MTAKKRNTNDVPDTPAPEPRKSLRTKPAATKAAKTTKLATARPSKTASKPSEIVAAPGASEAIDTASAAVDTPAPASAPASQPKARTKRAPRMAATTAGSSKKAGRAEPSAEQQPAVARGAQPLTILMVTPEAHPFAKTGGLAEVTAALPAALAALGHSVTIVLPRYRGIDTTAASSMQFAMSLGGRTEDVTVLQRPIGDRLTLALIDVPHLFDRESLYGTTEGDYPDNPWRFAVFSRAALEYQRLTGVRPSIIHAHDWQTGLVPVYQKMHLSDDPIVGRVPAVFTIHNLAFQGVFPSITLPQIGLGWEVYDVQAMEYWGQISYLKAGINFSERITTVSPGYAREITRPDLGFGFEGVLARRADDLVGILNGIDTARWNPSADPFVPASFSVDDLTGKEQARQALLAAAGLPTDGAATERPVIGMVSRMTDQKGFDLIASATDELMELDAAWVLLGSGERRYEELWRRLAASRPERVSATIGFDERLAHLIEAGADLFLMPSRFEPCGLNQLYSLRYGTVPVVRATGGLDDTVQDVAQSDGLGTGFKFADYSAQELLATLRRALTMYRNRAVWRQIQQAGMRKDHSWDASAREYVKVYRAAAGV